MRAMVAVAFWSYRNWSLPAVGEVITVALLGRTIQVDPPWSPPVIDIAPARGDPPVWSREDGFALRLIVGANGYEPP